MNLKINIKARLQRHSRNASFLKKKKTFFNFVKKFKFISFIIVLILPIYPSFGAMGVDKEYAVGNYDESTILSSYEGDSQSNNSTIFSQDSGFIKPSSAINSDRDMSGINSLVYYTIQSGDNIGAIASKFHVSVDSIAWSNDFATSNTLKPGDTIKIPPVSGIAYTVAPNDTLDSISAKYSVDKINILSQNQLDASAELKIGQQMILPGAKKPLPPKPIIIQQKPVAKATKLLTSSKTKTQKIVLESGYAIKYTGKGSKFAYGNCTYYVANHKNVTWRGNANQWMANAAAAGVPTGSVASAGAIISFRGSGYNPYYGHVGLVSEVGADYIIVKDMNYRRFNEVTVRKISKSDPSIRGYIYTN
ncbi:MAG: LysM peptidoglycan-binding domain-containing protein [Candidatus Gracilibacteria bacterium]|nr:LysM peptidoglycan-binding domain-containing protein [Candidatus Gracilibacteria bacterium]MDD2908156.1 LysM peptidoglycan-binding domain-containing protein [Candidatus Gracilibacteria bacterium]